MRTEKQKFVKFLEQQGFDVSNGEFGNKSSGFLFATFDITAHHRVTPRGNHNILNRIQIVNFDGSDTKKGDLGCVTFCYHGTQREFRRRRSEAAEVLKKAFCPKSAKVAIREYQQWEQDCQNTMKNWKVVL